MLTTGNDPAAEARGRQTVARHTRGHDERGDVLPTSAALTDARLADRVSDEALRGRFAWCPGLGWLGWDGRRWQVLGDDDTPVVDVVRRLFISWHLAAVESGADVDTVRRMAGLLSRSKITAVVALARGVVRVAASDLDQRPDLLNAGNGVVDLTTGRLLPHDPDLWLTKVTPVDYVPGAAHSDWTGGALGALPPEVADWLQVRVGQAATGHPVPDDVVPVLQGSGANGKSSLLAGILGALGEHATVAPERLVMVSPDAHPTELTTIRGARFVVLEELPEGRQINTKRVKDLAGTEQLTARKIRRDDVTWRATHTLMITTNYRPVIAETDHGTWRRFALVRFPYTFRAAHEELHGPEDRRGDPTLRERLKRGDDGRHEAALAWIVEGARRWYAAGRVLPPAPAAVRADTDAWRESTDRVLAFLHARLVPDPKGFVVASELYAAFLGDLGAGGARAWSDRTFAQRLREHNAAVRHGVTHGRRRSGDPGLSQPAGMLHAGSLPERVMAWSGLRFRTAQDTAEGLWSS